MRLSRAWLGPALVVLALPARANTVVQGMATVSGGYSTNPTGTAVAKGDFYDDIRPGLRLTSLFERGLFYAQYTFDATMYLSHGAASGYSNDVSVGTLLLTSRTTSLTLTAGFLQSQLNNIQALQTSAAAPVVVVPAGTSQFFTVRAAEGVNWDFTPSWHLGQTTTFTGFLPADPAARQSFDLNTLVDVGRSWKRDGLALQLRVDFVDFPASTVAGATIAGQAQLLDAVSARWLHDFGSFFSTELMAGVLLAMRAEDGGGRFFTAVGRAALHYRRQEGSVDLSYDHTADPSLLTGATYVNDTLALRGAVPLGARSRMALAASLAYQHSGIYDSTAEQRLSGSADLWLADLSWTWAPWREMTLFARYAFTDQIGNPADPIPIQTFLRHLVVVGVTIVYPAQAAAPAGFRPSVRADRSDAVVIPALHAPPQPAASPR